MKILIEMSGPVCYYSSFFVHFPYPVHGQTQRRGVSTALVGVKADGGTFKRVVNHTAWVCE